MVTYHIGDIFTSGADVLVNPVNCVGICGAGLALEFKKHFPDNYQAYKAYCAEKKLFKGQCFLYERPGQNPSCIVNAAIKGHWREPSTALYVGACLGEIERLFNLIRAEVKTVAVPALGLGQLPWEEVREVMGHIFGQVESPVNFMIYAPH